jgi:hypothetical protein
MSTLSHSITLEDISEKLVFLNPQTGRSGPLTGQALADAIKEIRELGLEEIMIEALTQN